ncbi:P-loop containing nucleoside triphosphate hydrolases superfamily protein [Melia azedarach]|uniref:P-loop containing nucleoside triphosphate hydrolases superfamily protein n=1 Tax=Melia azedarach TaxID=155640 RepID=A0ACC1YUX4_MELAZ|nr:P-loop containing nucleoside triphosphate hydrolases superfamily protein [Melia azedarach]
MLSFSLFHSSLPLDTQHKHQTSLFKQTQFPSLHFTPYPNFLLKKFYGYRTKFSIFFSSDSGVFSSVIDDFDVELGRLLALLPEEMRRRVSEHPQLYELIEVVMDLGRKPLARFPSGDFVLSDCPIALQDIEHATSQVGDFAIDNRAGISRTLHRISAIRNRKGAIIGLTCRVGRAVSGSANLLQDLVQDGASLLLIGPPGVGKTTIIREIARMLANDYKKRVMIVDTSNEIGGDGDIPHSGIGNARRMQVPNSDMQHKVLIEAVENHMPQVIVIDEIGTKLEAMAASTIAQRGIQLVATAHGVTIENLIMNPSLEMLVGGVQSVTLGDEEANRRGVQKTVLERKGPSTFACAAEIVSKTELRVHRSLEATVDAILSGRIPNVEIRRMHSEGLKDTVQTEICRDTSFNKKDEIMVEDGLQVIEERAGQNEFISEFPPNTREDSGEDGLPLQLYVYGILEASILQGIKQLKMDAAVQLTDNISEADALLSLHSKLKKNSRIQAAAKSHDIPIYVTKTSSLVQITKALRALIDDHTHGLKDFRSESKINLSERIDALEEARVAIEQVVIPKGETAELLPRPSYILSLQIELIRKYQLQYERVGKEPEARLHILPLQAKPDESRNSGETVDEDIEFDEFIGSSSNSNGTPYTVDRLPFLPDH